MAVGVDVTAGVDVIVAVAVGAGVAVGVGVDMGPTHSIGPSRSTGGGSNGASAGAVNVTMMTSRGLVPWPTQLKVRFARTLSPATPVSEMSAHLTVSGFTSSLSGSLHSIELNAPPGSGSKVVTSSTAGS